jgi:hypothetical protein
MRNSSFGAFWHMFCSGKPPFYYSACPDKKQVINKINIREKMKRSPLLWYLPIIPVHIQPGGKRAGWASFAGMQGVAFALALLIVVALFWFAKFYTHHPTLGKVIIGVLVVWGILLLIQWICSFGNDPLLRKEPYRRIYLDEENMKFNPMNEQNPTPKEKNGSLSKEKNEYK